MLQVKYNLQSLLFQNQNIHSLCNEICELDDKQEEKERKAQLRLQVNLFGVKSH